jgi:hypothetical protein
VTRLAAIVLLLAAGAPGVSRDGFQLALPKDWTESPKMSKQSAENMSPLTEGGATFWEKNDGKAFARVTWFKSKLESGEGVGVRDEVEALHEAWKTNSEGGRVTSWKTSEQKVFMQSTLTYTAGDPMEGKATVVHQVGIAGVHRDKKIRGWLLECGYPSSAAASEKLCAALAKSFSVTAAAKDFREIEPAKKAQAPKGEAKTP